MIFVSRKSYQQMFLNLERFQIKMSLKNHCSSQEVARITGKKIKLAGKPALVLQLRSNKTQNSSSQVSVINKRERVQKLCDVICEVDLFTFYKANWMNQTPLSNLF
jgi:hypothetical protein